MIEAMKQALDAMQFALHVGFDESSERQIKKGDKAAQQHRQAITSLRQAIEQAEKQCTHRLVDVTNPVVKSGYMCMASGLIPKLTTSTGSKLTTELPICVKQTGQ